MSYTLKRAIIDPVHRHAWLVLTVLTLLLSAPYPAAAQEGTNNRDTRSAVTVHVVQDGETVTSIAARYGLGVETLRRANALGAYDIITVGQRLIIPAADRIEAGAATATVGLGGSLDQIAARYRIPVEDLARLNRIANPAGLPAGQEVAVPAATPAGGPLVRVVDSLSLWRVALAHNISPTVLALANGVEHPALIAPGRLLSLPRDVEAPDDVMAAPLASVLLHPLPLQPGRTGGLRVETREPGTLTVTFLDSDWPVVSEGTQHPALLPVDRWTDPGVYPLTLTSTGESGTSATLTQMVSIVDGGYPREVIRLTGAAAETLANPADEAGEIAYVERTMSGFSEERHFADGPFLLPTAGVLASVFCTERAYNSDVFDRYHTGADLGGAPIGTPIYAPADGVVVDTGLLDARGYITIIDHGWGVYTGYWHQSAIFVRPGDTVTAGQQIGTIGNTGRSTAPHLHWEMRVHGVVVDPMQWVREEMP